ncbi:hypothetical protein V7787_36565 [Pseudomonas sp. CGJS7]
MVAVLTAQDILRLPLEQGVTGYDQVARGLRSNADFQVLRPEPPILKAATAITLADGYVVSDATIEDYKGERKLGLAFDRRKCFPLAQAAGVAGVEIGKAAPQEHDNERGRTFTAERNGMLAIFSTVGPESDCVSSITLTQLGK